MPIDNLLHVRVEDVLEDSVLKVPEHMDRTSFDDLMLTLCNETREQPTYFYHPINYVEHMMSFRFDVFTV